MPFAQWSTRSGHPSLARSQLRIVTDARQFDEPGVCRPRRGVGQEMGARPAVVWAVEKDYWNRAVNHDVREPITESAAPKAAVGHAAIQRRHDPHAVVLLNLRPKLFDLGLAGLVLSAAVLRVYPATHFLCLRCVPCMKPFALGAISPHDTRRPIHLFAIQAS